MNNAMRQRRAQARRRAPIEVLGAGIAVTLGAGESDVAYFDDDLGDIMDADPRTLTLDQLRIRSRARAALGMRFMRDKAYATPETRKINTHEAALRAGELVALREHIAALRADLAAGAPLAEGRRDWDGPGERIARLAAQIAAAEAQCRAVASLERKRIADGIRAARLAELDATAVRVPAVIEPCGTPPPEAATAALVMAPGAPSLAAVA